MHYHRNPRATLYAFSYGGLSDLTHTCLLNEIFAWGANLRSFTKGDDANIDRARSKVASKFLTEPEDVTGSVLLMVDADNGWQVGDLAYLARKALERNAVVGGIYPKRTFGQGFAFWPSEGGRYAIGDEDLIPAYYVGTGCIAIPRAILEAMRVGLPSCEGDAFVERITPFFMPYVLERNGKLYYPTDDSAFCGRVLDAGFGVFAATRPRVTHRGNHTYRGVDAYVSAPADRDVSIEIPA